MPATARGSPGGAGPGSLSPPPPLAGFPPLWPHTGRSSPPPTLPLSLPPHLILTSGRESRALSCLPAGRALPAPAVRRCCAPLRSPCSPLPSHPLAPPGAAPASGGHSRTWAPRGAPPAPRRPRLVPSPAAPSPAALPPAPIHLLCCSLSPSLSFLWTFVTAAAARMKTFRAGDA